MTNSEIKTIRLSAVISIHNEEKQLALCLETLSFADEIVVLLDKCSDDSELIAKRYTNRIFEGDWENEGLRRNQGISYCRGEWVYWKHSSV